MRKIHSGLDNDKFAVYLKDKIMDNLKRRTEFYIDWWDKIDHDTQEEIESSLIEVIKLSTRAVTFEEPQDELD